MRGACIQITTVLGTGPWSPFSRQIHITQLWCCYSLARDGGKRSTCLPLSYAGAAEENRRHLPAGKTPEPADRIQLTSLILRDRHAERQAAKVLATGTR